MYSSKQQVLLLTAALKAYNIEQVVISPGSRNVPLIHNLSQDTFFHCTNIVDERSAAFYALGLAQQTQRPVALCCTSGTALLNYGPAIAEAFYQNIPLIILSADRSPAWIGQMDGQTIAQQLPFQSLLKKVVQLPEPQDQQTIWYTKRLLHEAILAVNHRQPGPVQINIPLSEPLFDFSATALPEFEPIQRCFALTATAKRQFYQARKKLIIVGQLPFQHALIKPLEALAARGDCVILAEHLANLPDRPNLYKQQDLLLATINAQRLADLQPDLLISLGGHLISKRLKQFLRTHKPNTHWLLHPQGELIDLYQTLTDIFEQPAAELLTDLLQSAAPVTSSDQRYSQNWQQCMQTINGRKQTYYDYQHYPFSDWVAMAQFISQLPEKSQLFIANSSVVRNAQLFPLTETISVYCNRGTNGIDGALSTAIGIANRSNQLTFIMIGDLSFFYDLNALCQCPLSENIRIVLFNNGGGGIFYQLPGLTHSPALPTQIAATHQQRAKLWAMAAGIGYHAASDLHSVQQQLPNFMNKQSNQAQLLEIFTTMPQSSAAMDQLINHLKS